MYLCDKNKGVAVNEKNQMKIKHSSRKKNLKCI